LTAIKDMQPIWFWYDYKQFECSYQC